MKKIAIITLNGYFNYGNRLQNYALQESVNMLGYECDTIINNTNIRRDKKEHERSKIEMLLNMTLIEKLKWIKHRINRKKINKINDNRVDIFKKFSREYIKETDFTIEVNKIANEIPEMYDYFMSGSDQVWNPNDPMVSEINFLTFAPKYKRLSYAPSFGISEIPREYEEDYKIWLSGIENISVREEAGAKIIKELTGKTAQVLIDPTMLLTKEKWLSISKIAHNKPIRKYLLTYFLGELSSESKKKIKEIKSLYNLEIVNLSNIKDIKHYVTGPSEFIDYINSASIFMTDSFHGCVFSLLLETPLIVCDRKGHTKSQEMGSRIDTFLSKFKLESRKLNNIEDSDLFNNNYEKSNKLLEIERVKAWKFLKESIR